MIRLLAASNTRLARFAFVSLLPISSHAQHVLLAEHDGKVLPVRAASHAQPLVQVDETLVVANGRRFALRPAEEYLPAFVAIRHLQVRTIRTDVVDTAESINHHFQFKAQFISAYQLENVFIVLDLELESGSKQIFVYEVGRLRPKRPQSLDLVIPTGAPLGQGRYKLHVFSRGMEVLQSQQPFEYREQVLDRIVAKRLAGRPDGPPQPFIGPPLEYPPKLLKSKTPGTARLRLRIRTSGAVTDPVVLEATDPAFGDAALESLRQWRFFPAIKDGRPVERSIEMPLTFDPAQEEA